MRQLIMATRNAHKVDEVIPVLGSLCQVLSAAQVGIDGDIPEDHQTLEANAKQKAQHVYQRVGGCVCADDTGLDVQALNGAPGAFSARYAGAGCTFADNVQKLLYELQGITLRKARFRTVVCLIMEGQYHLFEGIVDGEILTQPSGNHGFGYDSIFRPEQSELSFAQMPLQQKNAISHRGKAVQALAAFLAKQWK